MANWFEQFSDDDAATLIGDYPLAWVQPAGGDLMRSAMVPLLAERAADGAIVALEGHIPRASPLYAALSDDPRAVILFQGPQAYISPTWVRDRAWAPTWNFAQLRIAADIAFEPAGGDASLAKLVDAMEEGRDNRWHIAEMGDRYRSLEQRIIAFRATVRQLAGRFKLGQDERPEILADILAHADPALARWMRRFNPGRC